MGNSEIGHNAIGCGRVFSQGAKLVNESIEIGMAFEEDGFDKFPRGPKLNEMAT